MKKSLFLGLTLILPFASLPAATLEEELSALKQSNRKKADPAVVKIFEEGVQAVEQSGVYERAKKKGEKAPDFTLPNATGDKVQLRELLKNGPVVLTWYRGGWCPYCNVALTALQNALPEIQEAGGQLVALTPELPDHSLDTKQKNQLKFEVLSDVGNKVARDYGIVFRMTPEVAELMQQYAKLRERNADDSDELPLSATYIVAPDGTITYAFLEADYTKRAEPSVIVKELKALRE